LLLGWYGWPALVAGTAGALTLTAVCGGVLRLSGRLPRGGQVPHGPAILAAALAVLLIVASRHSPA
jgi:leader peptidase (prepilin peptidase)/N-methyltransferase